MLVLKNTVNSETARMCLCVYIYIRARACVCTHVEASTDISPILVATGGGVVVPVCVNLVCFDIFTCSGSSRNVIAHSL